MNYQTRLVDLFLAPVLSSHELSGMQKQDFMDCTFSIPDWAIVSDCCVNEVFVNNLVRFIHKCKLRLQKVKQIYTTQEK